MSGLVLLDRDGVVARKLQLVSLPSDYVIPEGMMVSWRIELRVSSIDPQAPLEPVEAYFYLGSAWGQICRSEIKQDDEQNRSGPTRYNPRTLTITVQGTSAKDVMKLRERILHLINSGARWEASNNLNLNPKPKKSFLQKIMGK